MPTQSRVPVWAAGAVLALALSAQAASVVIESGRDNTIYQATNLMRSNGAGTAMFAGRTLETSNSARRALLWFDIAAAIPAGSIIESAVLTLQSEPCSGSGGQSVGVHRVLKSWGEDVSVAPGNQEYGDYSEDGDATWLHSFYYSPVPWNNPGGDFEATASTGRIVASPGSYAWPTAPLLVSDAQSFLDNPAGNFGWLLRGDELTNGTLKRFATRDAPNAAWRPRLEITYTPEPSTMLGLVAISAQILTKNRRR